MECVTANAKRSVERPLAGRVLVADDQPHILEALEMLLTNHGYRMEAVNHPTRVLQALDGGEFDVVLMDLNYTKDTTTGGEGLDLISQIRSRDKSLPVVVMTAWGAVDLAVDAMQRGASDFIQKPWENQQLLTKLREHIVRGNGLRRARYRREEELKEARAIQKKLLPRELPQAAGHELAGMTQPMHFVGGDYYNVVRLSDRHLALCIADVAGKGLPAALLMSSLQAALKPLIAQNLPPRELCRRLNGMMCDITPLGKFISFFYAVLDHKQDRLTYCGAGHNPPILVRQSGATVELNAAGAVLGQFPDWVYEQSDVELKAGDSLILFTDGLVEACGADLEPFGEDGVARVVRANPEKSATELMGSLMQAAFRHCGGRFQDDASMIVLKTN